MLRPFDGRVVGDAGAHFEAELAGRRDDRRRAANDAGGAVECRDRRLAAVADLMAARAHDLGAHDSVVPRDQLARGLVAGVGRVGDVYEADRSRSTANGG